MKASRLSLSVSLVGAVLGATLLAGCGDGSSGSAADSSTGSSTASTSGSSSPAPSSPAASSPTASSPAASSPASGAASPSPAKQATSAGVAICPLSHLEVGVREPAGGGAAGSRYVLLTFRNAGTGACVLDGHPGVSFVGQGNGTQIGDPAARTGGTRRVRLAPGATTTALLQIVDAGNYDPQQCHATHADGFRVYPPDSRASTFVRYGAVACRGHLGTEHQLTVSAVGHRA